MKATLHLCTPRLELRPFTGELVRALRSDRVAAAEILSARLPDDWPGKDTQVILPLLEDVFREDPDLCGWSGWAMVLPGRQRRVIGDIGFKGRPEDGRVEIGYALIASQRGKGYCTEAARELVAWALVHREVQVVCADCLKTNLSSIGVLQRLGMVRVGEDDEYYYWEVRKPPVVAG
ncbi:MAG: GNAT family N-acetyltransferase [Phycisphaerae bacterium]